MQCRSKHQLRVLLSGCLALGIILGLSGCRHEKPNVTYMPDMAYSPAIKAQQLGSIRTPVPGTVTRDYESYKYAKNPEGAGRELKNPLRPTEASFARGKDQYSKNCLVCHGPQAEGDGSIVPKFPRPPSLHSEKVRNWSDGRIFHVITMGQNLMPSYASQVTVADRWSIITYIRALQRSKHPTPADLQALSREESN